ncbi:hypothetical protein JMG10_20065 [Nostoc ellipsosporum NOK]|nr:hypothetical protein [Nostoc ellipsosporum NOK]
MQTTLANTSGRCVLLQPVFNTVLWIGHLSEQDGGHAGGQVFTNPSDGVLHSIRVYADIIPQPGLLRMSFHCFDDDPQVWGTPVAEAEVQVQARDSRRWIRFVLPPLQLTDKKKYGFQLHSADAMIGLGEAAGNSFNPFNAGAAWKAGAPGRKG